MPNIEGGLNPPSWAAEIQQRSVLGQRTILFLDEFSSMSDIVHAALLRVVNENVAGDTDFDPKSGPLRGHAVHIVGAANRKRHGASARDLPPPAANRMIHFEWPSPTAVEWAEGMLFGWKSPFYFELPTDWRQSAGKRQALEEIAAFLKFREGPKHDPILFAMPEPREMDERGSKRTGGPWPSPRSWELAADALGATLAAGAPKYVQLTAVEGAVGEGAAGELFTFRRYEDLPDPEAILRKPYDWKVDPDIVKLFITSQAIANAVMRKVTLDRYDRAWQAMEHAVDVTDDVPTLVMAARSLVDIKKDPRYKDVLAKWTPTPVVMKKFYPSLKKMGWV